MAGYPDVTCRRCERLNGPLYTVPIYLPATESGWQALCGDCFRGVLNIEPTDERTVRPVRHSRRNKRR
jgi:hypothetical protein